MTPAIVNQWFLIQHRCFPVLCRRNISSNIFVKRHFHSNFSMYFIYICVYIYIGRCRFITIYVYAYSCIHKHSFMNALHVPDIEELVKSCVVIQGILLIPGLAIVKRLIFLLTADTALQYFLLFFFTLRAQIITSRNCVYRNIAYHA